MTSRRITGRSSGLLNESRKMPPDQLRTRMSEFLQWELESSIAKREGLNDVYGGGSYRRELVYVLTPSLVQHIYIEEEEELEFNIYKEKREWVHTRKEVRECDQTVSQRTEHLENFLWSFLWVSKYLCNYLYECLTFLKMPTFLVLKVSMYLLIYFSYLSGWPWNDIG